MRGSDSSARNTIMGWKCTACTFEHDESDEDTKCSMCDTKRPSERRSSGRSTNGGGASSSKASIEVDDSSDEKSKNKRKGKEKRSRELSDTDDDDDDDFIQPSSKRLKVKRKQSPSNSPVRPVRSMRPKRHQGHSSLGCSRSELTRVGGHTSPTVFDSDDSSTEDLAPITAPPPKLILNRKYLKHPHECGPALLLAPQPLQFLQQQSAASPAVQALQSPLPEPARAVQQGSSSSPAFQAVQSQQPEPARAAAIDTSAIDVTGDTLPAPSTNRKPGKANKLSLSRQKQKSTVEGGSAGSSSNEEPTVPMETPQTHPAASTDNAAVSGPIQADNVAIEDAPGQLPVPIVVKPTTKLTVDLGSDSEDDGGVEERKEGMEAMHVGGAAAPAVVNVVSEPQVEPQQQSMEDINNSSPRLLGSQDHVQPTWKCPRCTLDNRARAKTCNACGNNRPLACSLPSTLPYPSSVKKKGKAAASPGALSEHGEASSPAASSAIDVDKEMSVGKEMDTASIEETTSSSRKRPRGKESPGTSSPMRKPRPQRLHTSVEQQPKMVTPAVESKVHKAESDYEDAQEEPDWVSQMHSTQQDVGAGGRVGSCTPPPPDDMSEEDKGGGSGGFAPPAEWEAKPKKAVRTPAVTLASAVPVVTAASMQEVCIIDEDDVPVQAQKPKQKAVSPHEWMCRSCGTVNNENLSRCKKCREKRAAIDQEIHDDDGNETQEEGSGNGDDKILDISDTRNISGGGSSGRGRGGGGSNANNNTSSGKAGFSASSCTTMPSNGADREFDVGHAPHTDASVQGQEESNQYEHGYEEYAGGYDDYDYNNDQEHEYSGNEHAYNDADGYGEEGDYEDGDWEGDEEEEFEAGASSTVDKLQLQHPSSSKHTDTQVSSKDKGKKSAASMPNTVPRHSFVDLTSTLSPARRPNTHEIVIDDDIDESGNEAEDTGYRRKWAPAPMSSVPNLANYPHFNSLSSIAAGGAGRKVDVQYGKFAQGFAGREEVEKEYKKIKHKNVAPKERKKVSRIYVLEMCI